MVDSYKNPIKTLKESKMKRVKIAALLGAVFLFGASAEASPVMPNFANVPTG